MGAPPFSESACRQRLQQGVMIMNIALSKQQQLDLMRFLSLLVKWNKAFNLTAVRDPLEMVGRHLLDSLVLLPHLTSINCLDIGTGAGLPGIPLAIMQSQTQFVLLDGNSKKIRFIRQAVMELGLKNVKPVHVRVESYHPESPFQTLLSRAFSALPKMLELTSELRGQETELLAMKGIIPSDEIAQLGPDYRCNIIPLQVPFDVGERCLVRIR
ncbi:MAG: 16S rRNA (guanine(527)-N(7))-methyltransferase RsmG [Candidatus Thiodiazotropha sp. (ex Lucinoma aequizonata)]|nr:16S rRNA (guanine(527)-N(7))-methyltransferase RsmG [Candidatus Thiodiazotropha sp. (ex Lucinoma aequizonata)]MCU7889210.1 16S rRNA (guanine(527)-N(7))-methyltransferase RsmG [Candidatus Thiodiazotropha sp. (ex Lucinoma aequizonata)]MCU7894368.1 16S rRNA (guanine(527)-N(7))-methyltransferase RsmG [Candidatus Thiodiazotropha sp. (ex Lucinoma aequizonata)]MCU7898309.1 16S rRNA (guanine(527)-N(7))-methyltransferase RsmG [Candidatus Thiodiazotropha sp. (ex Lucinoma aequizonata)]MCU7902236.1 16S 